YKVITPLNNPKKLLPSEYYNYPNIYLSFDDLNKKKSNLSEYQNIFTNENNIEKIIELEYLKTSLIRNEKLHNFKKLTKAIILLIISFIIHIVILNKEIYC